MLPLKQALNINDFQYCVQNESRSALEVSSADFQDEYFLKNCIICELRSGKTNAAMSRENIRWDKQSKPARSKTLSRGQLRAILAFKAVITRYKHEETAV